MTHDTPTSADQDDPSTVKICLKSHLAFTLASMAVLMAVYSILRLALLLYNSEQIGTTISITFDLEEERDQ